MLHFHWFVSEMFQLLRKTKRVKHSLKIGPRREKKKKQAELCLKKTLPKLWWKLKMTWTKVLPRNVNKSVTTDFCANPRIGNKTFSLKFFTYWDVFDHFYNPTQINDVLGPSGSEKKGLLKYNFKRICEPFLALHLTQQPRSRPRETTWPGTRLANPSIQLDAKSRFNVRKVDPLFSKSDYFVYGF